MKKETTITVTREDFIEFLATKGIAVPREAKIGGFETWDIDIMFPIVVRWAEMNVSLTALQIEDLQSLAGRGRKIDAIKRVRTWTGLGLKESKDWCEANLTFGPYEPNY